MSIDMTEIIPAINVDTFAQVERHIKIAEPHVRRIHIDVADGSFTPKAVWHNPRDLDDIKTPLLIEIHFMVMYPEKKIRDWLSKPIERLIFHLEAAEDPDFLIGVCHEHKKKCGAAIKPGTNWQALVPFAQKADFLQTLGVPPGPSGQEFRPETIEKIQNLHKKFPAVPIEVDGGINPKIANECKRAGANFIVVGESLFNSSFGFESALKNLEDALAS